MRDIIVGGRDLLRVLVRIQGGERDPRLDPCPLSGRGSTVIDSQLTSGSVPNARKVLVDCFVPGRPYVPGAVRGPGDPTDRWTSAVVDQTLGFPRLTASCELDVVFVLPSDRDIWELPWEMSLDTLLSHLLNTLGGTLLRRNPGESATVVDIHARKKVAREGEEPGAHIVIRQANSGGRRQPPAPPPIHHP